MSEEPLLPVVEVNPSGDVRCTVLWLHGLGADGHDFEPIVPELRLPPELGVRFVFPHAPRIPVTLNMGMVMPAWYDIRTLDARGQDETGILRSQGRIERLLRAEIERGVPAERIVLAGFSQGGAMALQTGLRFRPRLAGVMSLSAYLLLPERLEAEADDLDRDLPVFQAHGTFDPVVPVALGKRSRDELQRLGWSPEWRDYPMQHQVCLEEIEDVGAWLRRVLETSLET